MSPQARAVVPQPQDRNGHHPLTAGSLTHTLNWNRFQIADARDISQFLGTQPVVDVTITSPPYWDIKNYGTRNQIGFEQTLDEYLDDLVGVFSAVWRSTKPTGSLWVIMKSVKKSGKLYQLPFLLSERLTAHTHEPWILQDELVWQKTHTLPWAHRQKLTDNFEHILCFSKSKEFALRMDAVRSPEGMTNWWVKYPERYHPLGKALSNVWEIAIPTQGSWGNGHFEHFCPLPVELARRAIILSTDTDGTVLDPFAGTGSVAVAANQLGRKWLAFDINKVYRKMFERRLEHEGAVVTSHETRGDTALARTNLSLRQLKYALLLYKRVAPSQRLTVEDVPVIVVTAGRRQKSASPYWVTGVRVQFVLSDRTYRSQGVTVAKSVREQSGQPPLSKFQIEVEVEVLSHSQFRARGAFDGKPTVHVYSRGEVWRSARKVATSELPGITAEGKLPTIVSDLHVAEQPAY